MWQPTSAQPQPPAKKGKPKPGGNKPAKPKRKLWVSILKWGAITALGGAAILMATAAFVFWMYGRDPNLPDYQKLSDYRPKQVTRILDQNDRLIAELYEAEERRTFVPFDKVPPILIDAFIAAEDNKFWEHAGVDYIGMFRAFLANIRAGRTKQGASTITQQVVKTFLLTPEKTFKRKIQEIIIARRLEQKLTKQEILTLYVNQIYFGAGRYGIQEAARHYFGKDVGQINIGEAAMLAGMPKKPEEYAKALAGKNPQEAKDRQIYVLNQLVTIGKLTKEEAQKWIDRPIQIVKPNTDVGRAPEWRDLVLAELTEQFGADKVYYLGATVRTTLDPSLQAAAQKALQQGLRAVDKRQHIGRPVRSVKADKIAEEATRLGKRAPKGPDAKEPTAAVVTSVHDEDHEVVVAIGDWKGALVLDTPDDARFRDGDQKPSERFKAGDVVEVVLGRGEGKHAKHRVAFPAAPEGAVVVIENKTRKVRALVGGYAVKAGDLNRALKAKRQPGSSFKPFVYAAAIESGRYSPATIVNDAPEVFDLWRPKNYESGKFEGPVRLRHALAKSINTVAIRLTADLKPETVATFAQRMGIASTLPKEMSLALGSGEVTPLEMTNAIATIAAGGMAAAPRFIEAIDGKPTKATPGEQVLRPEVAYVTTNMMQSVVTEGTGHLAKKLGVPIAGKTGTSNDSRDVWFMGMTADYTIGVWIGYDAPKPMAKETGGTTAVPVFVDVVKAMSPSAKAFPKPANVVEAVIDTKTGLLAPEGAPKGSTRSEVFVQGTAPTEVAPMPDEVTGDTAVTGEYED